MLRNRRPARRLHAGVYLITAFLLFSGVALIGEGLPVLERVLGGHVSSARWHRWVGFALIALAGLVVAARAPAVGRFLGESLRFRRNDLLWFASYPGFLLRPSSRPPARHEGHFDPGQRVMNVVIVLSLAVLAATGAVMAFPALVIPEAFAWSLRLHRVGTWVLVGALAGHVLVASGILPGYRGVWRAMHGDGRVPARLAGVLWPRWAREQGRGEDG